EYGGGTVQLWDKGTWTPKSGDADAGLKKGALKFELKGERLTGGWALIRMRSETRPGRKTRNNWLLVKERDEAARPGEADALLDEDTSVKTGRTLEEIATSKRSKVWHSSRRPAEKPQRIAALKSSKPVAKGENVVAGVTISKP